MVFAALLGTTCLFTLESAPLTAQHHSSGWPACTVEVEYTLDLLTLYCSSICTCCRPAVPLRIFCQGHLPHMHCIIIDLNLQCLHPRHQPRVKQPSGSHCLERFACASKTW